MERMRAGAVSGRLLGTHRGRVRAGGRSSSRGERQLCPGGLRGKEAGHFAGFVFLTHPWVISILGGGEAVGIREVLDGGAAGAGAVVARWGAVCPTTL